MIRLLTHPHRTYASRCRQPVRTTPIQSSHQTRPALRGRRGHRCGARILAQQLTKQMGVAVIVENRAGANGNIGAEVVARAA